jgi:hypothetical protein
MGHFCGIFPVFKLCHLFAMATQDNEHFRLRIPDDLKARVAEAARVNNRSMTAEINFRINASFETEAGLAHKLDALSQKADAILTILETSSKRRRS